MSVLSPTRPCTPKVRTVVNHLETLVEPLDTARIREGALRILTEIGLAVPSADVRDRLADAGLRVADGRVFVDAGRASTLMERQRSQQTPEPEDAPLRLHSGSHALFHFDPEARCISPLTVAALEPYTKLLGALAQSGMIAAACCPGQPTDVEPRIAALTQQFLAARFIPDPPLYAYSLADMPYVAEMARILGKGVAVGVHPVSPLMLGGEEFELALRLIEEGTLASVSAAPMPVMGVTAPLDWVAGWAQAVAEAVGTAVALETLGAQRCSAFAALYVADMHTGGLIYGSPEHALITLAEATVNREILGNSRRAAKSLYTTARTPDPHAALEKTAHTVVALLAGYRELGGVGVLAVDEVFSPQQVFVDFDIVGHAWRVVRGLGETHGEGDVVALVNEGLSQPERFLGAAATLARFRDFYWSPGLLSDRRSAKAWLSDPTDALARARERAREMIAAYDYELDAARLKALRAVVESARKVLC